MKLLIIVENHTNEKSKFFELLLMMNLIDLKEFVLEC